jgi:hypothetical protein
MKPLPAPRPKFEWTKDRLEYLTTNGPREHVSIMSRYLGCSSETVYLKLKALGIIRTKRKSLHLNGHNGAKAGQAAINKINEEARVPWPQITTTMDAALAGRSFGGDKEKPGTEKPKLTRTRWVGDIGEAKSSMGKM